MFMSISTRKYREGAVVYFSRASRPFTAQSDSNFSLPINANRSCACRSALHLYCAKSVKVVKTYFHIDIIVLDQQNRLPMLTFSTAIR